MHVTPSADPQRSSVHINKIETRTAINYIITPDEYEGLFKYQGLFVGPTDGLFGFPAQVNTVRAKKLHACRALIHQTFSHQRVQAAFDIYNIYNVRPLKVKLPSEHCCAPLSVSILL